MQNENISPDIKEPGSTWERLKGAGTLACKFGAHRLPASGPELLRPGDRRGRIPHAARRDAPRWRQSAVVLGRFAMLPGAFSPRKRDYRMSVLPKPVRVRP